MAVTDTGGVQTGTAEWAIYAALKHGGTLLSTDGLDDLANEIWMLLSDTNSTKLVLIGPDGDLDIPAAATAEGVISISPASYVTFGLSIELLGVSGKRRDVHTYSSALIALNDALEDWANNLIAALEH